MSERLTLVIARWNQTEYKYEEYYRNSRVSSIRPQVMDGYHKPPEMLFRAYPMSDERDFEGDACSIVNFTLLHPAHDIYMYPAVEWTGFVNRMAAAYEVLENVPGKEPGKLYTPLQDDEWKPCSVRIAVWPYGTMHGED